MTLHVTGHHPEHDQSRPEEVPGGRRVRQADTRRRQDWRLEEERD